MKRNTISLEFRRSIAHCRSSHGEGQTPSLDWRRVGTRSLGAAHADPGTPNRTQSTACDTRTGQSTGSQHPDHQRAHRHALAIEGHTCCDAAHGHNTSIAHATTRGRRSRLRLRHTSPMMRCGPYWAPAVQRATRMVSMGGWMTMLTMSAHRHLQQPSARHIIAHTSSTAHL